MKWLHAKTDPTGNSSQYVYKSLGGANGIQELYISIDACRGAFNPSYSEFFDVFDVYGAAGITYPFDPSTDSPNADNGAGIWAVGDPVGAGPSDPNLIVTANPSSIAADISAEGLHTIKMHINLSPSPEVWEYIVDGTTFDITNVHTWHAAYMNQLDFVIVGGSFGAADNENYISNVKIGTTDWDSTDILSDDFSTGDYSKWDGVVDGESVGGLLEIVDSAPCAKANPVMRNLIRLT